MFKRKAEPKADPSEARFEQMMNLVKDLDKADYRRLKKAMDSGYEAYNIVRNIETEDDVIDKSESEFVEVK